MEEEVEGMERGQFTFYRSFFEAVKRLKKADRLSAYDAIASYALEGKLLPMTEAADAVFCLVRPVLDAAARKAEGRKSREKKEEANKDQTPNEDSKDTGKIPARPGQDTDKIPARYPQDTRNKGEKEREYEREYECERECEREYEKESYISPPLPPPAEKPKTGKVRFEALTGDDGFEAFWKAYPKKSGDIREACRLYLDAIDAGATLQQMLDALKWQAAQDAWTDQGGRYIPSPAKWLANKAWLQKPIKAKQPDKSGKRDAPSMDYGSPNRADYEAMQRLIDKMGTEETAKAVRDETGWSCGKCGASLGTARGGFEHCPKCGMKLIYDGGGKP